MAYLTVTPSRGEPLIFELKDDEVSIGSDDSCDLTIDDPHIDPLHAVIRRKDDVYLVENRSRQMATYLNYLPTEEADIFPGDEITVGQSSLIFEEKGEENSGAEKMVELVADKDLETTVGSTLPREDECLVDSEEITDKTSPALEAIYRVGNIIHGIENPDLLIEKLLEVILEVTRASRACFLGLDEEGELYPRSVASRDLKKNDKITISSSIANRVKEERDAILCTNARTDSRFQGATSISLGKIRSAICVPVEWQDHLFGVLYIDARGFTRDFTEFTPADLRLVKAIAGQAALALDYAYREEDLIRENKKLRRREQLRFGFIASSPGMKSILKKIARIAPTNSTVFLRGETGTGKEVVARAIHFNSKRKDKPLITVNCAAFPRTLLQSELFGHEKGAFTGAVSRKIGKFERARGGTIFLDEIAEIDPQSQVVLLRILEERKLERLGGERTIDVDVRVIAATNRDLDGAIAEGDFREDLYYRLKVLELFIPPLRERKDDIEPLIDFYLNFFSREGLRTVEGIESDALKRLQSYSWPGNVRELKNAVERILVLGSSPRITAAETDFISPKTGTEETGSSIQDMEKEHIIAALDRTGWNKKQAAEQLGINRATLYRKIKAYGITESDR